MHVSSVKYLMNWRDMDSGFAFSDVQDGKRAEKVNTVLYVLSRWRFIGTSTAIVLGVESTYYVRRAKIRTISRPRTGECVV